MSSSTEKSAEQHVDDGSTVLDEVVVGANRKQSFWQTLGSIFYEVSGNKKFDNDMQASMEMQKASGNEVSFGQAGWYAFHQNKFNEMALGNGSASPYARMRRLSGAASRATSVVKP